MWLTEEGRAPEFDEGTSRQARLFLEQGFDYERAGRTRRAELRYLEAADLARHANIWQIEAEGLRRLAVIRHHQGLHEDARSFIGRSLALAEAAADSGARAQCLNVMGGLALDVGDLAEARRCFAEAAGLAQSRDDVLAKIEQNLGIVANVAGDLALAHSHYLRALEICRRLDDEHGVAVAYHNLGMNAADRQNWSLADGYLKRALAIAIRTHDLRLEGLCRLNRAEVLTGRQQYEDAWDQAEAAQAIFSQLGSLLEEADVYRVLGTIFRHIGRARMSESYLTAAARHAEHTGAVLTEAESWRELGRLHADNGSEDRALEAFRQAANLFTRIGAQSDLAEVEARMATIG